jgi:hypothetical protein
MDLFLALSGIDLKVHDAVDWDHFPGTDECPVIANVTSGSLSVFFTIAPAHCNLMLEPLTTASFHEDQLLCPCRFDRQGPSFKASAWCR